MAEAFKPIAVRAPGDDRILFGVRCLLDLQLLTVFRFLRRELGACRGRVLDVGAGQAPWRELLAHVEYVGLDVDSAGEFGMQHLQDIVYYQGGAMPFPDRSFDHVLCSEVLEHVLDAQAFVTEIARVLRPGGTLVLTIPWSARLHHLPHDYRRLSPQGLRALLEPAGLSCLHVEERGNDIAVVANKTIVMLIRLTRTRTIARAMWCWPLALVFSPVVAAFVLAAHASLGLRLGSTEDPLGYGVVAARD